MSSAKITVVEFMRSLVNRAHYGIQGEKPLAVIAVLKYLDEHNITGRRLLDLLGGPEAWKIRQNFTELTDLYGRLKSSSASWNVIMGGEIQNAITNSPEVDEAFMRLTKAEISSLLNSHLHILRRKPKFPAKKTVTSRDRPRLPSKKMVYSSRHPAEKTTAIAQTVRRLLEFGKTIRPRELFPVLVEEAATTVETSPFAFALAAVLDRRTKSEIIWTIPYYIEKRTGRLDPFFFIDTSIEDLDELFRSLPAKPRYITDAPRTVKELARIVVRECDGDISKIWQKRSSAHVNATFQRIYGVGLGIASMIVLLLEKCFGVHFADLDHRNMDVKPDVHIIQVFHRLGFIQEPTETMALQAARMLNPEYPGALDPPAWVIGKKWCTPQVPKCWLCPLNEVCPKNIG